MALVAPSLTRSERVSSRPCPGCGASLGRALFSQRFAKIEGASVIDGYEVVACDVCGTCFADGIPTQSDLDRYYAEASKYEPPASGAVPPHELLRFAAEAQEIALVEPRRDVSILDVGSAGGGLLRALFTLGYTRLAGLDPSAQCTEALANHGGIEALCGSLAELGRSGRSFDVLLMFNVLEHLADLSAGLEQVAKVLVKDGLLVVSVPDAERFMAGEDAPFQQFSVEHVNYFTRESLARALHRGGLRLVSAWQGPRPFPRVPQHALGAAFRLGADGLAALTGRAATDALETYITRCQANEGALLVKLASALRGRPRLVVWGCGTLCLRWVASGALPIELVSCFVDSNPRYQGRYVCGVPIVSPTQASSAGLPVLITSLGQQGSIAEAARARFGADVELITLGD